MNNKSLKNDDTFYKLLTKEKIRMCQRKTIKFVKKGKSKRSR